jgi:hypothetical protein
METQEANAVYRLRGQTIEMVFADLKEHRGLRRFSGHGLTRAPHGVGLRGTGAQSARAASLLKSEAERAGE